MTKQFGSFSDAIRYGATLRGQCRGLLAFNGQTCAIGAAGEAMGYSLEDLNALGAGGILQHFPYMQDTSMECPVCDSFESLNTSLGTVVAHLNDTHNWPRDVIADWLQTEEDKLGFVTISVTEESDQGFNSPEAHRNLMGELRELAEVLK